MPANRRDHFSVKRQAKAPLSMTYNAPVTERIPATASGFQDGVESGRFPSGGGQTPTASIAL